MWKETLQKAVSKILLMITDKAGKAAIDATPDILVRIKNWWSGKSIAIIGPTASGKNSFFQRLKREDAPKEHIQTRGAENVGIFSFSWPLPDKSEVRFRCKNSINTGGEIDERERYWLQSCAFADIVFYLIDFEKLSNDPRKAKERIQDDFKWLSSNLSKFKSSSSIYFLINKVDILSNEIAAPSDMEEVISNQASSNMDDIEKLAKAVFGANFPRIIGISPISMLDDHIFSNYFTHVMQEIAAAKAL